MGQEKVTAINRRARRAYGAQRRRDERLEVSHVCCVNAAGTAAGVTHEVPITFSLFHDVHRVLGEPHCPRCPRCSALRLAGKLDRAPNKAQTLEAWAKLLEQEKARAASTAGQLSGAE